jgi:SAM-dependent methyltransferase
MTAEEFYQQSFRAEIMAQAPRSLCDIGCGGGALVGYVQALGVAAIGIDPDSARAADGKAKGLDLRPGTAEALPFADASFDVVTFENSLHHASDIGRALAEAARIARHAVVILDPWFDLSIPSQAACDRFERVLKRADRTTGMAHWDPIAAGTIVAALAAAPPRIVTIRHLLQLTPVIDAALEAMIGRALGQDPGVAGDLGACRAEAARTGFTEPGELLMTIRT